MGPHCILGFATCFNVLALLLVAIAFATDHWVDVTVRREEIKLIVKSSGSTNLNMSLYNDRNYFSRSSGMFRTCYEGNETKFLDSVDQDTVVDQSCILEQGYELEKREETLGWRDSGDYDIRIHLMRSQFAMFVLSLFFLLVAIFSGACGCWKYASMGLRVASFTGFVGMFLCAAGIAFFHGVKYLEEKKLNFPPFRYYWQNDQILDDNTNVELGYSYILSWLGVATAVTCSVLYLWSALKLKENKHQDEKHAEQSVTMEQQQQPQYVQQQPIIAPMPMMQAAPMMQPAAMMQPVPYAQSAYAGSVYGGDGYAQSAYGYNQF